ncbi:MAG: SH3 domain-containing protein [Flavobacterium sp.]|nr:MAG: SH3 domain-containing protein [Flavobacterium sp.]
MHFFKLLLITILSIVSLSVCRAELYRANLDANIRNGAGKRYDKIGTLKSGETVDINSIHGKWGEIKYNGSVGFISMSTLSSYTSSVKSSKTGTTSPWLTVLIILVIIIIFMKNSSFWRSIFPSYLGSANDYKYKCKSCGEKFYYAHKSAKCINGPTHKYYKI